MLVDCEFRWFVGKGFKAFALYKEPALVPSIGDEIEWKDSVFKITHRHWSVDSKRCTLYVDLLK